MADNNNRSRRRVIKTIGGSAIVSSAIFAGSAAADDGSSGKASKKNLDTGETVITDEDPTFSEISSQTTRYSTRSNGIDTSNVTHVASFNSDLNLTNSSGSVDYGEAEGHLTLYRALEQVNGEYVYFVWHHVTAYPDGGYGYSVSIQEMEAHIDVTDSNFKLTHFDPQSTESINEREHNFGINVGLPSGSSAGVSGNYYVSDGTVMPKNFSTGRAGEFAVFFDGNDSAQDTVSMNGVSEIRSEEKLTDSSGAWPGHKMSPKIRVAAEGHVG